MSNRKPPLELSVEVETADGATYTWDAHSRLASRRPQIAPFSSQRGDGFATGGVTLARNIMRDHPDIGLLDTVRIIGGDDVAWEGRIHGSPRTNDPYGQISPALVGWMTYAKRRRFREIYIDRDLSAWNEPSVQRRVNLKALTYSANDIGVETGRQDNGAAAPGITFSAQRFAAGVIESNELWYGSGIDIGKLLYDFVADPSGAVAAWLNQVLLSTDDLGTSTDVGTDHDATTATSQSVTASAAGRKYASIAVAYTGAFTGEAISLHSFRNIRVIGNHGLTVRGTGPQADGFYLSDIIRNIVERFCPKLTWAGDDNTYVVSQAAWKDPAYPYDGIQQMNDMALWNTSVFEDRKFYFYAPDLTTHDWQVRTDDPGVRLNLQGDSVEDFANGIEVTYTDLFSGRTVTLFPSDYSELRDDSDTNPANRWGEEAWTSVTLQQPTIIGDALQSGRAHLAEFNRPKAPGTIAIAGHIKDAAGNWQQGWKVREGETIAITDHPNDDPRLITNANWDPATKVLSVTIDGTVKRLDALNARVANRRAALNLG